MVYYPPIFRLVSDIILKAEKKMNDYYIIIILSADSDAKVFENSTIFHADLNI